MSKLFLFLLLFLFSCKPSVSNEKMDKDYQLPYYEDADFTPHWFMPGDTQLIDFHKVADFNFINQNGDTVNNETSKIKYMLRTSFSQRAQVFVLK